MSTHTWDTVWLNAQLATMTDGGNGGNGGYGEISDGALVVKDGVIAWVGKQSDLPTNYQTLTIHDANGAWMTPALIDCHTHIVYAGNRSNEFEARLNGATYAHIAAQGGGILSTVRATRMASEDELFNLSLPRVRRLMSEGVGVIEIKSGYGLDLDTEAKMLRVARRIGEALPITVKTTFLGAHALPPEFSDNADGYIDHVCDVMLPNLFQAGLVDAVDAFCEHIAFSPIQTERVFARARWAYPLNCMPSNCPTKAAYPWWRSMVGCRRIIWSICRQRGLRRCNAPTPWQRFYRARFIICAKPNCHR